MDTFFNSFEISLPLSVNRKKREKERERDHVTEFVIFRAVEQKNESRATFPPLILFRSWKLARRYIPRHVIKRGRELFDREFHVYTRREGGRKVAL